jgi:hypothetical protein
LIEAIAMNISKCTCIVGIGLLAGVPSIVATTEAADCERAICRNLQADLPHTNDDGQTPSPATLSATVKSSAPGPAGGVVHLTAADLVTASPTATVAFAIVR